MKNDITADKMRRDLFWIKAQIDAYNNAHEYWIIHGIQDDLTEEEKYEIAVKINEIRKDRETACRLYEYAEYYRNHELKDDENETDLS